MTWKTIERSNSTPWMFEDDGELEGTYLDSRSAKSKEGKPLTFHDFKLDNGEVVSVLGGTVLNRIFAGLEKGVKVKIEFEGEKKGINGPYNAYNVSIWED